jgi:hypothetical protein
MSTVFIRFVTDDDRTRGFATLAKQGRLSSLPGQIFQVPSEGLQLLESAHVRYRRATEAEVKAASGQFRDPRATGL